MITLLVLLGLEPYFQILKQKYSNQKNFLFSRLCINRSDKVRSTDPVDRRARLCMCARRPTARVDRAFVSALCLFRSTESADRFSPTVRNMTVGGPGRPIVVRKSDRLQQLYFLTDFVGISPQRISLAVYPVFHPL